VVRVTEWVGAVNQPVSWPHGGIRQKAYIDKVACQCCVARPLLGNLMEQAEGATPGSAQFHVEVDKWPLFGNLLR
jgi:hypothetical protein